MAEAKTRWSGIVGSVQPRIRLTRSFDQRTHSYLGFVLRLRGMIGEAEREFLVAVGEAGHAEHQFRVGDRVGGEGSQVADQRLEVAELYKVSQLEVLERGSASAPPPPPWVGIPPALPVYRERGHRRLDARTYESKCVTCIWGCRMPVAECRWR